MAGCMPARPLVMLCARGAAREGGGFSPPASSMKIKWGERWKHVLSLCGTVTYPLEQQLGWELLGMRVPRGGSGSRGEGCDLGSSRGAASRLRRVRKHWHNWKSGSSVAGGAEEA